MFYVIGQQILTGADGGFKDRLLQILDTSDGVAEWHTYDEVISIMKTLHVPIFGVRPLKIHHPTSGVFNKHVASVLLSKFVRCLFSIPSEVTLDSLGFATETLPNGDYGFDNFEYQGVVISGYMSKDMCTIYARIEVKTPDKIKSVDLYKSFTFVNKNTISLKVSADDVYTRRFATDVIVKVISEVVS